MTDRFATAAPIISLSLLVLILELVRRRKLVEEYSIGWIVASTSMVILSLRRQLLAGAAAWLGVASPSAVFMAVLIAFGLSIALGFSLIASRQRRQIEWLVEETAILSSELRELRDQLPSPNRPLE